MYLYIHDNEYNLNFDICLSIEAKNTIFKNNNYLTSIQSGKFTLENCNY